MRIPNKFSGYRFDGTRNLHDPVTLAAVASQAGGIGAASAGTTLLGGAAAAAPTLAAVAPVATSAGLGILPEATGILPQTLGGAQGIMQGAAPALEATTQAGLAQSVVPEAAKALPGVGGPPSEAEMVAMGQKFAANSPAAGNPNMAQQLTADLSNKVVPNSMKMPLETTAPTPPVGDFVKPAYGLDQGITEAATSQLKMPTSVNPMENGFMTAMKYATKNPLDVAGGLYAAQKMGILGDDNVGGPPKDNYKSKFDSSKFRAGNDAPPVNQYAAAPNFYSKTYAEGGNVGAVEAMSNMNAVGNNSMYPMANIPRLDYANPMQQRPISQNMMTMGGDVPTDPYTGMQKLAAGGISGFRKQLAKEEADRKAQGEALMEQVGSKVKGPGIFNYTLEQNTGRPDETAMSMFKGAAKRAGVKVAEMPKANIPQDFTYAAANGGIMHGLGGYSDGGRLLKGPGDGVSDSIPAVIGNKQPARLADGEFVVPARIVSELGNGSTEAGARQLYAMMERIQKGRRKSVGKGKVAVDSKSKKHLPA